MSDGAIDRDRIVTCAQELIREPSENPPGNESATAAVAETWCLDAGLSVERVEAAPGRTNLIATLDSGKPGRTLIFNGHLDVVPAMDPSLWRHPPYEAVIDGGFLHGRGSADMKGAIAAAIEAARALRDPGFSGRFVLQLVADEEVFGPMGTLTLRDRGLLTGDAAIVGEPTSLRVGIAQRGLFWTRVTTHGEAAHGSIPDHGLSAVEAMARVVLALRSLKFERSHPVLGTPSINVGRIQGGAKINIVPAVCEIEVDERVLPGDDRSALLGEITEIVERAASPAEATIDVINYADGYDITARSEIVKLALEAHEAVRGHVTDTTGMMGATDAAILNGAGVPAIVFGPGSLAVAHGTSENVPIAELADAAAMYLWIAGRFLA